MQFQRDVTQLRPGEQRAAVGQLKSADLLSDRACKCPFFMAEQFALKQTRGDGSAIQFHKGATLPRAEVVNRSCDQFLARPGLTADQDSRISGCDRLYLVKDLSQSRVLPNDVTEVVLSTNFLLQIRLLLRQLVLQRLDLVECECVLDGDGHLVGNELKEVHVGVVVHRELFTREDQSAQPTPGGGQRQPAVTLHSIRLHAFEHPRPALQVGELGRDQRLLRLPDQSSRIIVRTENHRKRLI